MYGLIVLALLCSCMLTPSLGFIKFNEKQNICVQGKFSCSAEVPTEDEVGRRHTHLGHRKYLHELKLKLYDEDLEPVNPDDLIAEHQTNVEGEFKLCGHGSDPVGDIDPILEVYSWCGKPKCVRRIRFKVPQHHIGKTFDLGQVDLANRTDNERELC